MTEQINSSPVAWRWHHKNAPSNWKLQPTPFYLVKGSGPLSDYVVQALYVAPQGFEAVRHAATKLLLACIEDFGDPADFEGDDGAVMSGKDGDGAVTFLHMRRLRSALNSLREPTE